MYQIYVKKSETRNILAIHAKNKDLNRDLLRTTSSYSNTVFYYKHD